MLQGNKYIYLKNTPQNFKPHRRPPHPVHVHHPADRDLVVAPALEKVEGGLGSPQLMGGPRVLHVEEDGVVTVELVVVRRVRMDPGEDQLYRSADSFYRSADSLYRSADSFYRSADFFYRSADSLYRSADSFFRSADSLYRSADSF